MEEGASSGVEPEATASFKSRHTVFLSHSGEQKAFVERLCVALEGCFLYPFFDKRDHSLPIGDNFVEKIFDAIKECHVGVVILSKKFFTSKWPMLELVAMVDEVAKRKGSFQILPIYYSVSTAEISDRENQMQWLLEWEKIAKLPRGGDATKWQAALDFIRPLNGLKYDGVSELRLEKRIVGLICELVPPEIRLDDTHIQGRDRLCKVILDNIDAWRKVKTDGVCVVGLYGVGGVGKTSICKVLCNKFFRKFQGRVCHTEFGKMSDEESMREVVKKLTGTSYERLHGFKEDKMRNMLKDGIIKEAVFLALDNMSDTLPSISEAKSYLSARLPLGSIVLVTARSLDSLLHLRPHLEKSNCMEMPELKVQEAKSLFAKSSDFERKNEADEQLLDCCVRQCYFRKDDGNMESYHFHPLALDVLGRQLGCIDSKHWMARLENIRKSGEDIFNQLRENNSHPIFSILRTSFDTMDLNDQMLFMDIGLYMPNYVSVDNVYSGLERTCMLPSIDQSSSSTNGAWRWLNMMHGTTGAKDVMSRLESLKSKSLLESLGDGIEARIGMHDLWRAFCVAETKSGELRCRRWVYETEKRNELVETSPSATCWAHVERMALRTKGSERVNFSHFPNVKVLQISGLCLTETHWVDLSGLCHLKSLEVSGRHLHRLVLQGLSKDLIFISLVPDMVHELVSPSRSFKEQLWQYSRLNSQQLMNQMKSLKELQFLWLDAHEGDKLPDMSGMASIRWAIFSCCSNVVKVTGLSSKLTNLIVLDLRGCTELRSCRGVGELVNLEELYFTGCESLQRLPDLRRLRNLRKLDVSGCSLLMVVPGLGDLVALEELYAGQIVTWHQLIDDKGLYNFELPDLSQLRHLRVLHLLRCNFRCCPGVGDLVNLEDLNCSRCDCIEILPNLENLTKLRKLNISGCPFIKEVRGLGELVALEELYAGTDFYDLYYDLYSLKLPDMRKLRNLRILRLPRCRLEAMPGFNGLISLQEMDADFREVVDRPSALRKLMKLQKLKIFGWSLERLTGLGYLGGLRTLDIRHCSGVDELPDFQTLTSLKNLSIINCQVKDVCGLRNLRALENLVIESCEIVEMPGLCNLNSLETLVIKGCQKFVKVPDVQGLARLGSLVVEKCSLLRAWDDEAESSNSDDRVYQRLSGLRTLSFSGCKSFGDVMRIAAFSQLEMLTCSSSPVETLPDLSNFPRLKYLYLSGCTSLRRLTSIKRSSALQLLDLDDCINLKALPDLGMFPALQKLWLEGCRALTTLSSSELLPALNVLDASGCRSLSRDDIDRLQASCPQCRIYQGLVQWSELSQYFMRYWSMEYKTPHLKRTKKDQEPDIELQSHLRSPFKVDAAPGLFGRSSSRPSSIPAQRR